jgi:AraC family transcriptional regulator, positive regulator of tynA and feaB
LKERLARCSKELLNPVCNGLSIEQIAYRNGFNDAAHFSKSFRARYGVSPREYRKRGDGGDAAQSAEEIPHTQ